MTTAAAASPDTATHERRITVALFAAGLTTFASMYSAQALLPSLSVAFAATPARAALAVSLTTGLLALAIVPVSVLSGRFGRTRVMIVSAVVSSVIGLLLPLSPNLDVLLAGRAIQGLALAGVPAVAMAYLAEEIGSAGLGAAMGVYVAGTSIGGLAGRLLPAFTLEVASWRWGDAAVAVAAALCTIWFVRCLPPSRRFEARPLGIRSLTSDLAGHLRHRTLLALFGLAFVLMGGFVSLYNFLGYRLIDAPFGLSAATAGLVFLMYLAGTVTSATAGRMADRHGRPRILALSVAVMAVGLLISLPDSLPFVLLGILLCTAGFFGAHSVASGWVGAAATGNRAAASSLYLFAYYLGSSIAGGAAGIAYGHHGWAGLTGYVGALLAIAIALTTTLARSARGHAISSGRIRNAA
ncbi:putative MFS family arabinose efflux permease [Nocardia transvalensis]|uniref:Putative MFS family arabinose efflux permease n=1 Tax=Nocardia transvalensis TaxID=37333 RepID=A0A7W9PMT1_9NOCA|nr:MFS transporter [Nocardia transvalensis]MBB5918539.1 putative MFS family arabinose efflux permease [Nocardia transvalensis]